MGKIMEHADVLAPLEDLYAGWLDGDADAIAACFTEDATSALPGSFRGDRATIRQRMAEGFAGPLKGTRTVDETMSVRHLGDGAAIVVSRSGIIFGEDESPRTWVLATWTLAKQDGKWMIAAYHNCPETVA
jgi:uncharacterized protein (TIGR02246 family)